MDVSSNLHVTATLHPQEAH